MEGAIEKTFNDIMIVAYDIQPTNEMFESYMEWAFGSEWRYVTTQEMPALWNQRHGDIFKFRIRNGFFDDLMVIPDTFPPMIGGWLNRKQ